MFESVRLLLQKVQSFLQADALLFRWHFLEAAAGQPCTRWSNRAKSTCCRGRRVWRVSLKQKEESSEATSLAGLAVGAERGAEISPVFLGPQRGLCFGRLQPPPKAGGSFRRYC